MPKSGYTQDNDDTRYAATSQNSNETIESAIIPNDVEQESADNLISTTDNATASSNVNGHNSKITNSENALPSIKTKLQLVNTRRDWNIQASYLARKTHNRIREVVESLKIQPNPDKPMIPLSIGDPTTFGNLRAADETMKALLRSVESGKFNGYAHTTGHETARQAIAKYSAHQSPGVKIETDNVLTCSGCSAALEYAILALVDVGQNILVPRPGFGLYETLTTGLNIQVRYYNLLPERNWEADLNQLEQLIDEQTAAVLINNPNNPCGSVFSQKHLEALINVCERHFLPIVADEIYEHFVFPGTKYIAVSSISKNVPVLSCGGLTKRFLVPGWRMGWIVIHDRNNRLSAVKHALKNMCARILGTNTLVQGALPEILEQTPQSFFDSTIEVIYGNAKLAFNLLKNVYGLKPIMPNGAMYMMIGIEIEHFPSIDNETQFVQELVNEQSVFCLPGSCFDYPNYFRIVLTVPQNMVEEACLRIKEFCIMHYKQN